MSNCGPGEVSYKGYCMPSYFTEEEMEERYQQLLSYERRGKKMRLIIGGIIVVTLIAGAVLWYGSVTG